MVKHSTANRVPFSHEGFHGNGRAAPGAPPLRPKPCDRRIPPGAMSRSASPARCPDGATAPPANRLQTGLAAARQAVHVRDNAAIARDDPALPAQAGFRLMPQDRFPRSSTNDEEVIEQ